MHRYTLERGDRGTRGGGVLGVRGSGFGVRAWPNSSAPLCDLTIGRVAVAVLSWNQTYAQVVVPEGQGVNLSVVVTAGHQTSAASKSRTFWYARGRGRIRNCIRELGALPGLHSRILGCIRIWIREWGRRYDAPVVQPPARGAWVSNTSGLNADGTRATISIQGENFGRYGRVYIGDGTWIDSSNGNQTLWYVCDTHMRFLYGPPMRHMKPMCVTWAGCRYNHTHVRVYVPEGDGANYTVRVSASGQNSSQAYTFSYRPPWLALAAPLSTPTDSCFQWEPLTASNKGVDGTGTPLRRCCQPAFMTLTGANFGVHPLVVAINGTVVTDTCADVPICPAACRDDLFFQNNHQADCAPGRCCQYNYPLDVDNPDVCFCPVLSHPCFVTRSHTLVQLRPPTGFGVHGRLTVTVGGQTSGVRQHDYDPPLIRSVRDYPCVRALAHVHFGGGHATRVHARMGFL